MARRFTVVTETNARMKVRVFLLLVHEVECLHVSNITHTLRSYRF